MLTGIEAEASLQARTAGQCLRGLPVTLLTTRRRYWAVLIKEGLAIAYRPGAAAKAGWAAHWYDS